MFWGGQVHLTACVERSLPAYAMLSSIAEKKNAKCHATAGITLELWRVKFGGLCGCGVAKHTIFLNFPSKRYQGLIGVHVTVFAVSGGVIGVLVESSSPHESELNQRVKIQANRERPGSYQIGGADCMHGAWEPRCLLHVVVPLCKCVAVQRFSL